MIKSFNVIYQNFNAQKFEPYDVIPYFIDKYKELNLKSRPKTFEEFKEFIKKESLYMFWARCEYEIIIAGWPNKETQEKWDIHRQIMMNIDLVTRLVMESIK